MDTAGAEPPKYQAFRTMLRMISEQEEGINTAAAPEVEQLAASMHDLAVAIGNANGNAR
ncbi:hypothetical protein FRC11_012847, partial [Ceratobasidium sp. 423]